MNPEQRRQKVQEFVNRYDGQAIVVDGILGADPYGAQCVCLANEWCRFLGIEPFEGNAANFAFDAHPDCDFIRNTPADKPERGDIIVWQANDETPYGHVDVCIWATVRTILGFDQNWPEGSLCHQQLHDYSGVAGWLRPHCLR